jgi:transposase
LFSALSTLGRLQPRREVWRLADNAALLSLTRSDQVADHHQSGRNIDTGLEGRVRLAVGIARIMQCGWYKEVHVKDLDSHAIKALLVSRALLVKIKRDLENQIRGLLKNLGLVIGRAKMNVFAARAAELAEVRPELAAAVEPLLKAREAVERQIVDLDRKVMRLARNDAQVRRFMAAPGIGPITALCFLATVDDPIASASEPMSD